MSTIRRASLQDLPGTYRVCLATGDSGRDATGVYTNPDLLGHVFVGPYVVGEPDLALVVADEQGVAGYALAAADTRAFEAWAERHWWPLLRAQYPLAPGDSADHELVRWIHAPELAPASVVTDYPAHLHLDLLERVRGQGFGRALIERTMGSLRERRIPGVHLDVAADNPNGISFYGHLGFIELERKADSVLMGRRLQPSS